VRVSEIEEISKNPVTTSGDVGTARSHLRALLAPVTLEVESTDGTATEVGRYKLMTTDATVADVGKHIVNWHRVDGKWLRHRNIINRSNPPVN
jgi:hypothetical protein